MGSRAAAGQRGGGAAFRATAPAVSSLEVAYLSRTEDERPRREEPEPSLSLQCAGKAHCCSSQDKARDGIGEPQTRAESEDNRDVECC